MHTGSPKCMHRVAMAHHPKPSSHYKALLAQIPGIDDVTVVVNFCAGSDPTRLT
jgi:hypothetical protein